MKKHLLSLIILLIGLFLFGQAKAQISEGGTPPSFKFRGVQTSVPLYEAPIDFNIDELFEEDEEREEMGLPPRCAHIIPTNVSSEDYGVWTSLPDGTQIWQLEIYAPGALAVMLTYSKFIIPEGGKLFLYNPNHTKVLGAYSEKTNKLKQEFATEFVYGDRVIFEYIAAEKAGEEPTPPQLDIMEIHYGYNHIWVPLEDGTWTKSLKVDNCYININCPEGDDWQDQKKGVAKIICGGGLCSGTIVNNTAEDFDPLFLSAYHCYEKVTTAQINTSVYYFHYESSDCDAYDIVPGMKTMVGAQYLVKVPWVGGSDGALLRFNEPIPEDYDVYYNGWDRTNNAATNGVAIHHPGGISKKVSTFTETLTSMKYNTCANNAHWKVFWSATESGRSSTEGGSSGSPLFNQNGLVVGTLSGGQASCSNPAGLDAYGKLWYHWDQCGDNPVNHMKTYLDPLNTGVETLKGSYRFRADFTYAPEDVYAEEPVRFTSTSIASTTWDWTFEGGTPATSTDENPEVVFSSTGTFSVSLCVNKGTATEETKTVTIEVKEGILPAADFLINESDEDAVEVYQGEVVVFTDSSVGSNNSYSWIFTNGEPNISTDKDPEIVFTGLGECQVTLTVNNYFGSSSKVKTVVVKAQAPVADFSSSSDYFTKYPDYGQFLPYEGGSVVIKDESAHFPSTWNWTFSGAEPSSSDQAQTTVEYAPGSNSYTVKLNSGNNMGASEKEATDYIKVGGVAPVWNIPFGKSGDSYFLISSENYLTGNNTSYSVIAERFENSAKGTIDKLDILFKAVEGDPTANLYSISIFSEKDNKPGASLVAKNLQGSLISQEGYTEVEFAKTAEVEGPFYVVITGLGNKTNKVAVGASEVESGTTYIKTSSNQWKPLSDHFEGQWNVSMNIVPRFTYKVPQLTIAPVVLTANYDAENAAVNLEWTYEGQYPEQVKYEIYRDNQLIASGIKGNTYSDTEFADEGEYCYTVQGVYDGFDDQKTEKSSVACVTANSIGNVFADENVEIYPNPVKENLNIRTGGSIEQIVVQDIQGRVLLSMNVNDKNTCTVSTSDWEKGVYIVKLITKNSIYNYKVIKQ